MYIYIYIVLSGEIITSQEALKQHLTEKLAMHSTNVRKSFRKLDRDYSGSLDRYEFRRFLENLNIHTTLGKITFYKCLLSFFFIYLTKKGLLNTHTSVLFSYMNMQEYMIQINLTLITNFKINN